MNATPIPAVERDSTAVEINTIALSAASGSGDNAGK